MTARADHLAAYRRLVELAETECVLAQTGRTDELTALQGEWAQAMLQLPPTPPVDAKPLLRRALALSAQSQHALSAGMTELQRELGQAGRSRAVGRAYSPAAGAPERTSIDLAA